MELFKWVPDIVHTSKIFQTGILFYWPWLNKTEMKYRWITPLCYLSPSLSFYFHKIDRTNKLPGGWRILYSLHSTCIPFPHESLREQKICLRPATHIDFVSFGTLGICISLRNILHDSHTFWTVYNFIVYNFIVIICVLA